MSGGVAYDSVDTFGVPGRVLSLSDEFFNALVRVAESVMLELSDKWRMGMRRIVS